MPRNEKNTVIEIKMSVIFIQQTFVFSLCHNISDYSIVNNYLEEGFEDITQKTAQIYKEKIK